MQTSAPVPPAADDGAGTEALRAFVIGLAMACPFDQTNPPACALHDVRELPMRQRLAWATALGADELAKIVRTHDACLHRKEQAAGERS